MLTALVIALCIVPAILIVYFAIGTLFYLTSLIVSGYASMLYLISSIILSKNNKVTQFLRNVAFWSYTVGRYTYHVSNGDYYIHKYIPRPIHFYFCRGYLDSFSNLRNKLTKNKVLQ